MPTLTTDLMSQDDLTLTIQRQIEAPPEKVYAAWLEPELLMKFMANCTGMVLVSAKTDPRIGGSFELVMLNGGKPVPHTGTYLALDPHTRIEFTWVSPYSTAENSTVTIDLKAEAGGGTLLSLTHRRFIDARHRDMHLGGWTTMLDGLVATRL